jgi:2-polyprenyl-3-methyl-5-hydroxy-6-metoxy-1,4-benzoquinol methylase
MIDEMEVAAAHARLAAKQLAQSAYGPALQSLATALALAPQVDDYWAQFSELIQYFRFRHPADPRLRELLARALEHPAVDPASLVNPIASIALSRPAPGALEDPLLLGLLEAAVVRDAALEEIMVSARREALLAVWQGPTLPLGTLAALAHQAFNTEYVYDESDDERRRLEALAASLDGTAQAPLHRYAVYALYRALGSAPGAERIAAELAASPLASVARRQILEPIEEGRLRDTIASLGEAQNRVSAAVRAQYESNPYPRWLRTQSSFAAGTIAEIVRELFPHADPAGLPQGAARILVAGCGTGQNAIATARRFRGSSVLAIDLSLASLAYAKRKTHELGVRNIDYRQGDLLALGAWPERFELVECSGVLHHLEDPFEGWRVLAALLAPRGLMRVGLYSEAGRRHVVRGRELVEAQGFEPSAEGIRRCRAAIRDRTEDALLARIARSEDFFSLSGCRDLLFHVQEHRFTLPAVRDMLERLDLQFIGFELADGGATAAAYRSRFPDDPASTNLANWERFEQDHPDAFARMYQFWTRKAA